MLVFPSVEAFVKAFEDHSVILGRTDSVLVNECLYSASGHDIRDNKIVMTLSPEYDSHPKLTLEWTLKGVVWAPTTILVEAAESAVAIGESAPCACDILEHTASIAGIRIQAKVDETVTQPTLRIGKDAFSIAQRDPDNTLPAMGRLTLNESTVFVYEDASTDELIIPSIIVESLDLVLHNVRVKTEYDECTHLALPPDLHS